MHIMTFVSALFIVVSLCFLATAWRDYAKHGSGMTMARRIWLRMAIIFALVAAGLFLVRYSIYN